MATKTAPAPRRTAPIFAVLITALFLAAIGALFVGQYGVSVRDTLDALMNPDGANSTIVTIIVNIRLPRMLGSIVLGAALALAGNTYQIVFRNYLVSQDVLGVSTGAGVGVAIAILLGRSAQFIQGAAFVAGMISIGLTLGLASVFRRADKTLSLILSGILTAGFMTSCLGLLKYLADPETQLQSIVFWTMGSLASVTLNQLASIGVPVALSALVLLALRWKLTLFSFDDTEALSIGVNIKVLRYVAIICATVLIACTVSVAGSIGWVGLVIPHIARLICGSDTKDVLPMSMVIGALFLLAIDIFARQNFAAEIPLGIFTGFIGTPIFVGVLVYRFTRSRP